MSEPSLDFPQDDLPVEKTPKIEKPKKKLSAPRGKPILGKLLFFILIVALIIAGFVFVQKTLLDLDAQAQIYAVQTVAAIASPVIKGSTPLPPTLASFPSTERAPTADSIATPLPPSPTATPNPDFMHTATIAAQLTLAAKQ